MLAVGANSTAIMAALPDMRTVLSLSPGGVEWAVNAYLVVSAACIVLGGQAADRFGARAASIAGLVLFGLASCIIALAQTQTELLAGRALQGLASAFAVPSTLAAVDTGAPPERRTAAIGAWTGFLMLGFSIGPLFGGALTHFVGWRAIFWFNVLLMAVAIAGMMAAGSVTGRAHSKQSRRADWIGFALLATFMVSLVFALHALPHVHTAPLPVIVPFALAAVALVLLLSVESRIEAPLVDLGFFARQRLRDGHRHRLAGDVQHHGPAALFQSLCPEPQRARPHGAAGGRRTAAAERRAACARAVGVDGRQTAGTAQRHDGRHGADRRRERHHSRRGRGRRRNGAPGDRLSGDGRRPCGALRAGAAPRIVRIGA